MVTAHELGHIVQNGKKDGEHACDLYMIDALDKFRTERALFDEFVKRQVFRTEQKQARLAAAATPEAKLERTIAKTQAALKQWSRRQKVAVGKVKRYASKLRRLERRATAIQVSTELALAACQAQ